MPRRNKDGKLIIPATEVAEYSLCPESWRLKEIARVHKKMDYEIIKIGNKEHEVWSNLLDKASDLLFVVKLLIVLLGIMAVLASL